MNCLCLILHYFSIFFSLVQHGILKAADFFEIKSNNFFKFRPWEGERERNSPRELNG